MKSSSETPSKRASRWKILSFMSLRYRIALYYTGATAVLFAIVFAGIVFTVNNAVYRNLDEVLQEEAIETLLETHIDQHDFNGFPPEGMRYTGDFMVSHYEEHHQDLDSEFIQFTDDTGRIVKKSAALFDNSLVFVRSEQEFLYHNRMLGSLTVRQLQVSLTNRQGAVKGYLIIAIPLKGAMLVLREMTTITLIAFPFIIILLFVVTRLIAGQSIRPIEEVIATAETITQTNFERRIALPTNRDELYRMSVTINALLDRLHDAFFREKQFTADASHELKTPLAVVKGTLEVLVRKPRDVEHYENRIHYCLTELNRMARLIDQLLLLARFENRSKRPDIVAIDLTVPIHDVIDRMQAFSSEKGMTIMADLRSPVMVTADSYLLEIIIENILSNAIKYSTAGTSVEIRLVRRVEIVVCEIEDHGVGIPEEKLAFVFDRFFRVDESRSSSTGGSGLGLSIVRKLADIQSIEVSVTSTPGKGTIFTLAFPVREN